MSALSLAIAFSVRLFLVLLFLPFSALDKILDFNHAVAQAEEVAPRRPVAVGLILVGLTVEIFMSLAVLTGIADRLGALILAAYCCATAVLWKQFWRPDDFWTQPEGKARSLFWDFLKNFAVAGGFLAIAFGTNAASARAFFTHPLASSHPYSLQGTQP